MVPSHERVRYIKQSTKITVTKFEVSIDFHPFRVELKFKKWVTNATLTMPPLWGNLSVVNSTTSDLPPPLPVKISSRSADYSFHVIKK